MRLSIIVLLCLEGFLSATAWAGKTKITVFVVPASEQKPQVMARVSRALSEALRSNPQLEVEDSDKLLLQFSGEVPTDAINNAQDTLMKGLAQLKDGDAVHAAETLEAAVNALEPLLPFVEKQWLARAMMGLGVAQAQMGRTQRAVATFTQLLTWRQQLRYDTSSFSTRFIPLFEKARAAVDNSKRGSVELSSSPAGAKVYVDGRYMGITPTVVFGLQAGEHYATYKLPGYLKAVQKITASPLAQQQYQQQLKQNEKYLLLKQALAHAKKGLGRPEANAAMVDLRSFLFIDQVVFAMVDHAEGGQLRVQAFAYDLRSRLRLNQSSKVFDPRTLAGIDKLAHQLYVEVRYDGRVDAPPEAPPPAPKKRRPFYATWWFWTAVGAGLATAIVLPLELWPKSNPCPSGNRCVVVPN